MNLKTILAACSISLSAAGAAYAVHAWRDRAASPCSTAPIAGRYVEARTASVFAGACHYNGELVTAGREALLAWSFESGEIGDASLAGVDAVVVVRAERNLELASERESIVYLPPRFPASAEAALTAWLAKETGGAIGRVREVRRAPVVVDVDDRGYAVAVGDLASLEGELLADRACCKMPQSVWYEPMAAVEQRVVGNSSEFRFADRSFGDPWSRHDANDAFVGRFGTREPSLGCAAPMTMSSAD